MPADLIRALRSDVEHAIGSANVQAIVLKHGRPFVPQPRPTGMRLRKKKYCFVNSATLAIEERGMYVEGYAMTPDGFHFAHAWITRDGIHALDATLRSILHFQFLGIPFPQKALSKEISAKMGILPLLDDTMSFDELEALIARVQNAV
jgi:hypothetical protein